MNVRTRAHVIIEEDILREIDRLVGRKKGVVLSLKPQRKSYRD